MKYGVSEKALPIGHDAQRVDPREIDTVDFERRRAAPCDFDRDQRKRPVARSDIEEPRPGRQGREKPLPRASDIAAVAVGRIGRARRNAPATPEVLPLRKRRDQAT